MSKSRLAAFSGGVFAVIITILVLDLKAPGGTTLAALDSRLTWSRQLSARNLIAHLLPVRVLPKKTDAAITYLYTHPLC